MWKLVRMSLHCFSLLFSPSVFVETIIECVKGLSPVDCWKLLPPGIYEDASAFSLMNVYYIHTKLGIGRQRGWWREFFYVHGNLGSMFEIQQQLAVLSRQLGQLASRFIGSERQRAEEAATAAAMQAAQKAEEERRKGQKVQEWNAWMSSTIGSLALLLLQADTVQLRRRSKSRGKLLATFRNRAEWRS